jgi:hypothetical protein
MPAKAKFVDKVIEKIRSTRGLPVRIAEACDIERAAVYQWEQVPLTRVHVVAEVLGMKPEDIRPDFFNPKKRKR